MSNSSKQFPARSRARKLQQQAAMLRGRADVLEKKAIALLSPAECRNAARRIRQSNDNIALFLGAGASKSFGWPLTNELLPSILNALIEETLFEDTRINSEKINASDRTHLQKTLKALCPGLQLNPRFIKTNKHRLPLVTSLLTMLDFSLVSGQALITKMSPDGIKHARMLLERAIYEIVEREDEPTGPYNWPPREPNNRTKQLVKWLERIRETSNIGFITSNYDVAIERVWRFDHDNDIAMKTLAIDFGFDWLWPSNDDEETIRRPEVPQRRLYKLHGSTNWLRCGLCDRVYINPEVDIAVYAYQRRSRPNNACHCGHAKLEVQIVSPSFVREVKAPNLISVWQQALSWLRRAEEWIIIGYSFPDEDMNIRSLFTRALAGHSSSPHITAIQLGANEQTRVRYEAFFSPGNLTFLKGGLETFLDNLD